MLRCKSFDNAKVVLAGIELIHKLKKGQYGIPHSFGRFSRDIWRNVLAALNPGATKPIERFGSGSAFGNYTWPTSAV
jgi:hypothetical protein